MGIIGDMLLKLTHRLTQTGSLVLVIGVKRSHVYDHVQYVHNVQTTCTVMSPILLAVVV